MSHLPGAGETGLPFILSDFVYRLDIIKSTLLFMSQRRLSIQNTKAVGIGIGKSPIPVVSVSVSD